MSEVKAPKPEVGTPKKSENYFTPSNALLHTEKTRTWLNLCAGVAADVKIPPQLFKPA